MMKVYIAEILIIPEKDTITKERIECDLSVTLSYAEKFSYGGIKLKDAEVVLCEEE